MRAIFIFILTMLLTSCASSNLTSSWVDRTYLNFPITSSLVVAMSDNLRVRRIFEDDMVKNYKRRGLMQFQALKYIQINYHQKQIYRVILRKIVYKQYLLLS